MKIAFLLQVASDARSQKRIRALQNIGVQPAVLAFERDFYEGKTTPEGFESLGRIDHGRYYKRFIPFLQAIFKIRASAKKNDVLFAFGLDVLLLAWLSNRGLKRKPQIVYEVADIREILLGKGLLPRCMRWLERFLLRRINLLVVTSKAYVSGFYREIQELTGLRHLVIENKPEPKDFAGLPDFSCGDPRNDILSIGYFGVIRCPRSWEILKRAVKAANGKVQLYVRGYPLGVENLEEDCDSSPYIEYGGPYVAPDELPFIYGRVDMVWACYPYQGDQIGNYLWARTNRFYESCYFKRPMFAQAGTEDGRVVENLELGTCLDLSNVDSAVEDILNITITELRIWQDNIAQIPKEIYTLNDEHRQLLEMLHPAQTEAKGTL